MNPNYTIPHSEAATESLSQRSMSKRASFLELTPGFEASQISCSLRSTRPDSELLLPIVF